MNTNTTTKSAEVQAGDVIEFVHEGAEVSALVLLASDEMAILDLCDDSMPMVVKWKELGDFRRFDDIDVADVLVAA